MDSFIREYYAKNKNSGCLRVTVKDEIIYEKSIGFANIATKTPFNKDSIFTLYSLSKPFCGMGIMKLKEKGKVDLDAHPSKYVPEAANFDKRVTIDMALRHISGLPDFVQTAKFNEKYDSGTASQIRTQLKELAKYPSVFEPGTSFMYANINYIIPALIIENISGMKYADYMKKEIFEPLGMSTAVVDNENLIIDNRVEGHELKDGEPTTIDRTTDWMFGAGDILGTLDDVYCLNKAIKHRTLLKNETWDEILGKCIGCWQSIWHGKKRLTHNGGSQGFRTLHIQLCEDDFDIIFLSNSGWGDARNDFAEAIHAAYYGNDTLASDEVKMDVGYI